MLIPKSNRTAAEGKIRNPLESIDGADEDTEPDRVGLAAERDLLHIALDMPLTSRPGSQEAV